MSDARELLDALRSAVDDGRAPAPAVRLALVETADPAVVRRAGRMLARLSTNDPGELRPLRLAVLATCTVGPFQHLLQASLVAGGMLPAIEPADYGAFELALATAAFAAGDTGPDLVACLMDESYFVPGDWATGDLGGLAKHIEERAERLCHLVAACLERTSATLVLHTVPLPAQLRDTVISWRARAALAQAWYRLNAALLGLAAEHRQVVVVDLVGALAEAAVAARDDRLHRYGDLPYTDAALLILAQQVRRVAQARLGLGRKVLALDLDGTLWGGVLGEVGAHGVQLGGLYPGNCYLQLQRTVARLRDQGVILVLASKNDAELVERALTEHPEVLLRPQAFSVRAVNWAAKAGNLSQAAETLGLPVASFVFMDDSPFERGHVRSEEPEVAVVAADGDPAYLVRSLLANGWFDVMDLTETDLARPDLYRSRALRSEYSSGFASSERYLHALGTQVLAEPVTAFTAGRAAQLAARTNQFNLTGVRFDEAQTAAMSTDPQHLVASFSVSDRFGSEGIVGAAWVHRGQHAWRVLNLVLSCRVLGRGVELAIVDWLAAQARRAGAAVLEGTFVASRKNGPASGFWIRAGCSSDDDRGVYSLDLSHAPGVLPAWITLRETP